MKYQRKTRDEWNVFAKIEGEYEHVLTAFNRRAAHEARAYFEGIGLESFIKLHGHIPLSNVVG
jgi:hypothetical protein